MKNSLKHLNTNPNLFVILCIFTFPVSFLIIRHGVHAPLFALAILATFHFWGSKLPHIIKNDSIDIVILLTFSGLFLSVLISQIFNCALHFAAFDGPSRLLIAGMVFIFIRRLNVPYIKILSISIPVGLICVFLSVKLNPDAYWGDRYAIYFVDPNTLGSQTFILSLLSFLLIEWSGKKNIALTALQVLGGFLGLYISIGSGSRGGWLTAPFILLLILFLRFGDISRASYFLRRRMWMQTFVVCISICFLFLMGFYFSEKLSVRIMSGYFDVRNWFSGANLEGSAGIRLSMWKFGFQFANESLLFGFGEEKNVIQALQNSPLNISVNKAAIDTIAGTGPHSDILSKLLSAGLFGLGAYLSLLLVPFSFFWKYRNALDFNVQRAARIGLFYITGIFIAGLFNEQLSLKYLCTFYGLMVAALLAQVLNRPSSITPISQS